MNAPLYSLDVLRLAAASADTPRLDYANSSAERRSAVCGSRITVDVVTDAAGRVTQYGHEVRACALGQASATIFARGIIGCGRDEIVEARDALAAFLGGSVDLPPEWPDIEILARARPYTARHPAILLGFDAAIDALGAANG